ncbi:Hsp20/alpha crystallin family protein [Candidatus Roizmanbacteria bacterium]|nr:MAG: Hsp20/alpha crystallin family protein [Candidatus Roizmanbacteria bacterium]
MANLKLSSPLARMMFRPVFSEWDEDWPQPAMTEGLDIYEEDDTVVVKAAVPGVPAENVDVEYENGVLHIHARYEESQEEKEKKTVVYRQDRVSSFDYSTTLPRTIDPQTMEAHVEDGVIRVSAKVAEEAKRKRIPVKALGGGSKK